MVKTKAICFIGEALEFFDNLEVTSDVDKRSIKIIVDFFEHLEILLSDVLEKHYSMNWLLSRYSDELVLRVKKYHEGEDDE